MSVPTLYIAGSITFPEDAKKEVPIDYIKSWFARRDHSSISLADRVLILKADTGSGKSTSLPVELMRTLRPRENADRPYVGKSIICTQPRVLTAIDIANSLVDWAPDMIIGVSVGYRTGSQKRTPQHGCGLIYATVETLTVEINTLTADQIMAKYKYIIIDEVHERSSNIQTDLLLIKIKQFMLQNLNKPELPFLIISSATFDTARFAEFFTVPYETNIIEVSGFTFRKDKMWATSDVHRIIPETVDLIQQIHKNQDPVNTGDILVFVNSIKMEGQILLKRLKNIDFGSRPILFLQVDSTAVNMKNRDNILLNTPIDETFEMINGYLPVRKVIFVTNVAETGLTVKTAKYVIDHGWAIGGETYFPYGITGIITRPETQSRAIQRMGRVGRKFPGVAYFLFTESVFNMLEKDQLSSVYINGLNEIFLSLINDQTKDGSDFDIRKIDMIDPPPSMVLLNNLEIALATGLFDGKHLTHLGEFAVQFDKLTMEQSRFILSGYVWNTSISDLILYISAITARDIKNVKPYSLCPHDDIFYELLQQFSVDKKMVLDIVKYIIADNFIVQILQISIVINKMNELPFDEFVSWMKKFEIYESIFMILLSRRDECIDMLVKAGLDPFENSDKQLLYSKTPEEFVERIINIKHCIYDAYRLNLLTYDPESRLYRNRHNLEIKSTAIATMFAVKEDKQTIFPKYIVTNKLTIKQNKSTSHNELKPD